MGPEMNDDRRFGDKFRSGAESSRTDSSRQGRLPGESENATEELRYEGPISFSDEAPDSSHSAGSSGKTMFTAALLGAAVILIISVALYLKDRTPDGTDIALAEPPPAGSLGLDDDPAEIEVGPAVESETLQPEPMDATPSRQDAPLRPAPTEPSPAVGERQARALPPVERPSPSPASAPSPQRTAPAELGGTPTPRARPTASGASLTGGSTAVSGGLQELVASGRLEEAARLAQDRARFSAAGSFTLQVLFACERSTVESAFEQGGDNLMLFPVESADRSCYRLTWGMFTSREAALAEVGRVPAYFARSEKPLPITIARAAGI